MTPSASTPRIVAKPARSAWPLPGGPRLAVMAGQGVGPIRFGATVDTIERQMGEKCEIITPVLCRFFGRALDFELLDGKVVRITAYRVDRPAGKDSTGKERVFGVFNGGIPPDLRLGMLPWAIQQHLGQPKRVEKLPGPGTDHVAEIHYYDGLVLDYDLLENGKLALGAIHVEKK